LILGTVVGTFLSLPLHPYLTKYTSQKN